MSQLCYIGLISVKVLFSLVESCIPIFTRYYMYRKKKKQGASSSLKVKRIQKGIFLKVKKFL